MTCVALTEFCAKMAKRIDKLNVGQIELIVTRQNH